ncbi:MAG: hypothetical protein AAB336_05215 [Acidobacteriota bacterium]
MPIKSFFFLFLLTILSTQTAIAQHCGGSYLNLELKFEKNTKIPETVSYELFYVLPKLKNTREIWDEKTIEFVSKFYYGDIKKGKYQFWKLSESKYEFLKVSPEKAEKYLKNYKLEEFEVVYKAVYKEDHSKQLKGEFSFKRLTLKTGEMDITPFLMKISAGEFETLYFLSDFFGGCHDSGNKHPILMKENKAVKNHSPNSYSIFFILNGQQS